jgi:hypothetical protein
MPVRLTETAIDRAIREVAEGARRNLTDATCPGLRLRLTPAGAASWVLACRDRLGRMRRFPLGTFPDMGISEARGEARGDEPEGGSVAHHAPAGAAASGRVEAKRGRTRRGQRTKRGPCTRPMLAVMHVSWASR